MSYLEFYNSVPIVIIYTYNQYKCGVVMTTWKAVETSQSNIV